jgi:hypothetical protein
MNKLVEAIINRNFALAKEIFEEEISGVAVEKLEEAKKIVNASEQITMVRKAFNGGPGARQEKLYRDVIEGDSNPNMDSEKETNKLAEDELEEARIKIVKARIRGGKVQRRKKVSNVPGYTLRGGQLKRMSPMERRRRKLGQRKGKIKRKAKLQRALMKRKRSLMRRKSIGLG